MNEKVKISQVIIERAHDAKSFIREAGEDEVPDELLLRAATAFGMLERSGFIATTRTEPGCGSHEVDGFDRAFAIATIAGSFADNPPDTPQRAAIFSAPLDLEKRE